MARVKDRETAIKLRLQGKTYAEIKKIVSVQKSTLSYWLRGVNLTAEQISKITKGTISRRVETYIETTRKRREKIIQEYVDREKINLLPLTNRDIFMAGLFLYLGEGSKTSLWSSIIANTNPEIIKFSIFWFTKILDVKKVDIKIRTHLYSDMDIDKELHYWQKVTKLPASQFAKPYIKKSKLSQLNRNSFGHGTCTVAVYNVAIKHRIIAALRVILEEVNKGGPVAQLVRAAVL